MITEQMLIDFGTLDKEGKWHCIQCGACCAFHGCAHLSDDMKCKIYKDRPHMCRADTFGIEGFAMAKSCYIFYEWVAFGG